MWNYTLEEILLGLVFFVLFIVIVVAGCWLAVQVDNKAAAEFKLENPDTATIWNNQRMFWRVIIKKIDGKKAFRFENSLTDGSGGTYILAGEHVLTLVHENLDEQVNKTREYKEKRISTMKVKVEAGKDYTLLYEYLPGNYSLIAGKPESFKDDLNQGTSI